jgi:hypothetical protein
MNLTTSEKGNALFLILVAIALFASISYVVVKTSGGGGADASQEIDNIKINQFFEYYTAVKSAVDLLRFSNNCSAEPISFTNDSDGDGDWTDNDDGYYNPNSPNDFSCHIFHEYGGGIAEKQFGHMVHDSNYGTIRFVTGDNGGAYTIRGFGSDSRHELFMWLQHRADLDNYDAARKLCKYINKKFNIPEAPGNLEELPSVYHGPFNTKFAGTFNDSASALSHGSQLAKYPMFCASAHGNTVMYVAAPLIVR